MGYRLRILHRYQLAKKSLGQKLKTMSKKTMTTKAPHSGHSVEKYDVGRDRGMGRQIEKGEGGVSEREKRRRRRARESYKFRKFIHSVRQSAFFF